MVAMSSALSFRAGHGSGARRKTRIESCHISQSQAARHVDPPVGGVGW